MSLKLHIKQYRKLKNINIEFTNNVNIIAGTNGTCKSSLLYLVSNSFQAVTKKSDWIKDKTCLNIVNNLNSMINPKVEKMARGDKIYNDPARGIRGELFNVEYYDSKQNLRFRRHNSKNDKSNNSNTDRYAVKPMYKPSQKEKLPYNMIIYLGLQRLVPFGEFRDDKKIKTIKYELPKRYLDDLVFLYKRFTSNDIEYKASEDMGDIKKRAYFSTNIEGIDSNTISAGEDNLFIILKALVSLKYYYESYKEYTENQKVCGILLIDELDATLHPKYQNKLLDILNTYSAEYKIQIIFTTHSISLLEYAKREKYNIIYFIEYLDSVTPRINPDIEQIKMHLKVNTIHDDNSEKKLIPIFTEDDEARIFLQIIIDYFKEKYKSEFVKVSALFYFINAKLGCGNLKTIFRDDKLKLIGCWSICILDGDAKAESKSSILSLPGKMSPEELAFSHIYKLLKSTNHVFYNDSNIDKGYTWQYLTGIKDEIEDIKKRLSEIKKEVNTKGKKREYNKKLFNKYKPFFKDILKSWVYDDDNRKELLYFYKQFNNMFKKVSGFHDINPNMWNITD